MKKFDMQTNEEVHERNGELANLFRVLSKPDALRLFTHTADGINNSTYAIEELNLTPKRYYARLRELTNIGLVKKQDGVYEHTGMGRMIYDRFLPAMRKTVDAREELEFLVNLEGMEIESGIRKIILDDLKIPGFSDSPKVKLLGDYEALAIEAIDLYDSAEKNVLLASNYWDVRVIEAIFRSLDRGITNRFIMGKNRRSSKIQTLRMMLSITFAKTLINFASNTSELKKMVRFVDLPYTFCVVDGHRSIVEFSNPLNESFIAALSIDDRGVGEKLTKLFEMLWEAGEFYSAIEGLNYIKSS